jgi:hypothetical protein
MLLNNVLAFAHLENNMNEIGIAVVEVVFVVNISTFHAKKETNKKTIF